MEIRILLGVTCMIKKYKPRVVVVFLYQMMSNVFSSNNDRLQKKQTKNLSITPL